MPTPPRRLPVFRIGRAPRYVPLCLLSFFLTTACATAPGAPPAATDTVTTATASSGEGDYRAALAVDGNRQTRWGSEFHDNQWLMLKFGAPREFAGLRIWWETAYGKDYDVQISDDGQSWKTVSTIRQGDGGFDEIFFSPRSAQYVKIQGVKRGTGWGYSIWEVELIAKDSLPVVTAAASDAGSDPMRALDGEVTTSWSGAGPLAMDFRQARDLGGLEIVWGPRAPSGYAVEISDDATTWRPAYKVPSTDGGSDLVFFSRARARHLRIVMDGAAEVAEIRPKSGDEAWTLGRDYEATATRLPDGSLPYWLRRQQAYWTIVGVAGDLHETLLGEDGTIEPYKGSWSVMPFLKEGERTHLPRNWATTHTLLDSSLPIPTASFSGENLTLAVTAIASGARDASWSAVRYRVTNSASESRSVQLALAFRPLQLNPPWQYGGMAPIRDAQWDAARRTWRFDNRDAAWFLTAPTTVAAARGDEVGDAYTWFASGRIPSASAANHPEGLISALSTFTLALPPGGSAEVVVAYPMHPATPVVKSTGDAGTWFASQLESSRRAWTTRLGGWSVSEPLGQLGHVVRANLAYMILNRDRAAAQPGPRNYAHAWMRDGAVSTATYLRFGYNDIAKEYLTWFTSLVREDGFVPFLVDAVEGKMPGFTNDWKEYDSQGEYVYAVSQYIRYSGDRAFAGRTWPAVQRALRYQEDRLNERRTPKQQGTEYWGILPESNSHEGYFPGQHSYWDDFWGIRGLKDASALAAMLGKPADAARYRAQADTLRADVHASMLKVIRRANISYLPGCAEKADPDATSTSIAFTACDEGSALLADTNLRTPLLAGYNSYWSGIMGRFNGGSWSSFTPYEARNIEALVRLGQRDRALQLLSFLIGEPMRPKGWLLLGEVTHPDPRTGSYIGDMPHTWVSADIINAIRSFFVHEDEDALVLAAGVPAEWLKPGGASAPIAITGFRTLFGVVGYSLERRADGAVVLKGQGQAAPPGGILVRLPVKAISATVDGRAATIRDGAVFVPRMPRELVIRVEG